MTQMAKKPRQRTALVQLKIRMREPLRERLEEEASRRGDSINAEVVDRVEHTFKRQDLLSEVLSLTFGGEPLAGLLIMLGIAMLDQGRRLTEGKGDWTSDSVAYDAAVFAATQLLDYGRPDGSRASASDYEVATKWVEKLIEGLKGGRADEILGRDPRADAIMRLIGPIVTRMSEALKRDARASRTSSKKIREVR
jgi:hypothetical protein